MSSQANIFLLLFGALQGLLLSLSLLRKKAFRGEYFFLAIYILVMVLQITLKVVSKMWLYDNMHPLYALSYHFPFLYGPLVYLFTSYLLIPGRKPFLADALHFIPFVLSIVAMSIFFLSPQHNWFLSLFLDGRIAICIQIAAAIIYHTLAFQIWTSHGNRFGATRKQTRTWLRNFIVGSFGVSLTIALAIYFMYQYYPVLNYLKWVFAALSLFIYWLSYVALTDSEVFSVIRGGSEAVDSETHEAHLIVHRPSQRYNNSGLTNEEASRIISALHKSAKMSKPYLDSTITIDKLAATLGCSRHHLSQVLNEYQGQSFFDFINSYRIAEAKRLLSDPQMIHLKIASVAFDSGFSSLSTFNEVFKKSTGIPPSQYRIQNSIQQRKQSN